MNQITKSYIIIILIIINTKCKNLLNVYYEINETNYKEYLFNDSCDKVLIFDDLYFLNNDRFKYKIEKKFYKKYFINEAGNNVLEINTNRILDFNYYLISSYILDNNDSIIIFLVKENDKEFGISTESMHIGSFYNNKLEFSTPIIRYNYTFFPFLNYMESCIINKNLININSFGDKKSLYKTYVDMFNRWTNSNSSEEENLMNLSVIINNIEQYNRNLKQIEFNIELYSANFPKINNDLKELTLEGKFVNAYQLKNKNSLLIILKEIDKNCKELFAYRIKNNTILHEYKIGELIIDNKNNRLINYLKKTIIIEDKNSIQIITNDIIGNKNTILFSK